MKHGGTTTYFALFRTGALPQPVLSTLSSGSFNAWIKVPESACR